MLEKMILVDLETQDFPVETGIYEVACIVVENNEIVDRLYLANPIPGYKGSKKYGKGYYDISRDGDAIKNFKDFFEKYPYPVVAHNCPFDKKFLIYYQWLPSDYPFYCSMRAIRYEKLPIKSYGMDALSKYYQVIIKDQHTAFGDVMALYEILMKAQPTLWLKVGEKK